MKKYITLLVWVLLAVGILPQLASAQPYNATSYLCRTEADAWINISGTSMPEIATSSFGDQNTSNPITIPFNFRIADRVSNTFRVTPAGTVFMDSAYYASVYESSSYGYWIETDIGYEGLIIAEDEAASYGEYIFTPPYALIPVGAWMASAAVGASWQYAIVGSAPNRKLVVETDHNQSYYGYVYGGSGGSDVGSWQVIMSEAGTSTVEYAYHTISTSASYQWYAPDGAVTGIKVGGEEIYTYPPGSYQYPPSNNWWVSVSTNAAYNTPGVSPPISYTGYYDNEYNHLPTVSYRIFIAYPYDLAAQSINYPANNSIILKDVAFTPTATISNQGSQNPTAASIRRQIWRLGDPSPVYTANLSLPTDGPIPAAFSSSNFNFPSFTPTDYGIYEDSLFIVSTTPTDQSSSNNVAASEFTVSPPNNIKTITVLNPAPNSRTPINVSTPIGARFKNIGGNGQINVPVTATIKDPQGNIVYRDTAFIPNIPSGVTYDTAFREYTFTQNGQYTVCAIAILAADQLRADDTSCTPVAVRYADDVAATGNFNPQPDEEKPYTKPWRPFGIFQSVGVSDEFDVPARVQIRRCSDGALVFQADSTIPELNVDKGQVKFGFPTDQGNYHITKLTPGCYTQCVIAKYPTDGDRSNDTACTTFTVIDRLKGNIEVGVGKRFQTLTAARDSMIFRGIGGNLNLILTDANYTENGQTDASSQFGALDFGDITGTDKDTAVVTFKPKQGVSPVITFTGNRPYCIYYGRGLAHGTPYINWDGNNQLVPTADLVTAEPVKRGMTIVNNSTAAGAIFGIEYGAHDLAIRNMKLHSNGKYTNDSSSVIRFYNESTQNSYLSGVRDTSISHNVRIDNNELGGARYGVWAMGLHPMFKLGPGVFMDQRDYNNRIARNTIGTSTWPLGRAGISYDNEENLTIAHNEVSWVNSTLAGLTSAVGIGAAGNGNSVGVWVDANKVHNITGGAGGIGGILNYQSATVYTNGTGVNQSKSVLPVNTRNRVTNNAIYDLRSPSNYPVIYQTFASNYFTDKDSVFNNSISVSNAVTGVYMTQSLHPMIWNNILQLKNSATGSAYVLGTARPFVASFGSDNNLFDLTANQTFAVASEYDRSTGNFIQSRTFRRLNDWRTFTGQDLHSQVGNPSFSSDSLHLPNALSYIASPASNNGAWLNTASQYFDFDGDSRQTGSLTPDIGSDEFDGFQYLNDVGVLTITRPSGYSATSDTTLVTTENPLPIEALLKNYGQQLSPNRVVTAKLEVAISGGAWTQIWTSAQTVSFDVNQTQDLSWTGPVITTAQAQTGVFRVTITVDNDQNNANNVQQKTFRVLLKNNAVLLSYESTTVKGLQNRDSVSAALRRLGVPYDSLDRAAYSAIDLDYTPYWTLIWSSGDPNVSVSGTTSIGGVSFKATEEIERYLNAGQTYAKKSLIMAGQNIALYNDASNINGNNITDTIFTHQYVHTKYVGTTPVVGGYAGFLSGKQVYFTFADSINCASPDVVKRAQVTGTVGDNVSDLAYVYRTHPAVPTDSAAGTTWHGSTTNVVFYAFDWADALQTNPSETGINTSGTTRILRGALDFLTSFHGTILPVEFVDVTATAKTSGNEIAWQVAQQKDVAHYDVESLTGTAVTGTTWTKVGEVSATAGSTGSSSYTFMDSRVTAGSTYTYHVVSVDLNGARTVSQTVNVTRTLPSDFTLGQNYPNPFNPTTTIAYQLPSPAVVTLKVIDLTGKVIRTELDQVSETAGQHSYLFTADGLASGTYVYELTATRPTGETVVISKKMALNK